MAQKPIKKVKVNEKPSSYKKTLAKPKTDSQKVSKRINKKAVDDQTDKYKALMVVEKKPKGSQKNAPKAAKKSKKL